ncbi:PLP-dependent aminotransferase family protein [Spongiactinospora sp. TRM90649]|uniref:aminotransferase-like domain-containing protein n=1 Tax=Spongiactinospora sp. TRM90649 TaxID=3031114 RepID=UPI0023F68A0D|nr:PLP-dependent aminotransferase family protein [Spongiactinospora sp. TRM90649]MDF5758228.1 PLP-dependent aminotransferase family protein [Spongiactinospora sp. TRM90649]
MAEDYRAVADAIAARIASGELRPGERLPAQRAFARAHRIASSTAARVYGELIRRGLAVGEVGRGTFVRAAGAPSDPPLAEPAAARVDLELNFSVLPEQPALLAPALDGMLRPAALAAALGPLGVAGTPAARDAAAGALSRGGWSPDPRHLLFAGSGRQAIAATIAALVPSGERLGVEALTYPIVKGVAARLGITLVPLPMDEHGLDPDAVRAALPLRALYLQPALHNPLGVTMPEHRRLDLARLLRDHDLVAIEDAVYAFLRDDLAPLAALAPERTVVVDSLSKRIAPGLSAGFIMPPGPPAPKIAAALRSAGWAASPFALEAATRWMTQGVTAVVEAAKRADAAERQRLAAEHLAGFDLLADPAAYHCWWRLPEPWRADTFVAAAARRGIAVTPAAAFATGPGHAPNAVRLALASPPLPVLSTALDALATLAEEDDTGVE